MRKLITFIAGLLVLAAIFFVIVGSAVVAGMWCLHMAGLAITYTQAAWILLALWCWWLAVRLFGATFAWLQKRGNRAATAGNVHGTSHRRVARPPQPRRQLSQRPPTPFSWAQGATPAGALAFRPR